MRQSSDPSHRISPVNKETLQIKIGFSLVVLLFAGELLWAYGYIKNKQEQSSQKQITTITPGVKPEPKPRPLPQGKQTFTVSTASDTKGPRATFVVIDPYDPKIGEKQTVTVDANDTSDITSASITLITDKTQKTYPLSLKSGTAEKGTWEGSWATEDTHDVIYTVRFNGVDAQNKTKLDVTIR